MPIHTPLALLTNIHRWEAVPNARIRPIYEFYLDCIHQVVQDNRIALLEDGRPHLVGSAGAAATRSQKALTDEKQKVHRLIVEAAWIAMSE